MIIQNDEVVRIQGRHNPVDDVMDYNGISTSSPSGDHKYFKLDNQYGLFNRDRIARRSNYQVERLV